MRPLIIGLIVLLIADFAVLALLSNSEASVGRTILLIVFNPLPQSLVILVYLFAFGSRRS